MATSKAIRADDASGLNIATVQATEDAATKDFQRVVLNDPTTPGNMVGVDGSGNLKVTGAVTVSGTVAVKPTDGTNALSKTFDLDSSGSTHEWNIGVGLRKSASGGSVEVGTSSNPLRTDPTGTTSQPVSVGDGSDTTFGAKADAKSTATDTTAISAMSVLKQISASVQAPPSQAVTNAGTFATQAAQSGTWTVQPGNTPNTTAWKVDASSAAVPVTDNSGSLTVDNGGTFAVQVATGPAAAGVTLKSVVISSSSSGNNTLIAAVTSKKITVVAFALSFSGTVNAKFQDGASGTDLTGLFYGIANSGAGSATSAPGFLFQGSTNTLLNLNLSGSVAVGGFVAYYEA